MKYRSNILVALAATVLTIILHLSACTPQANQPPNQPTVNASRPIEQTQLSTTPANVTVKIHNFKFDPANLKINMGEGVKFVNSDEEPHTVTATDGTFDSKAIDTNEAWNYRFTKAGKFPYICAIHPFMKGTVTVITTGEKYAPQKVH